MAVLTAALFGPMQVVGRLVMMGPARFISNFSLTAIAFGLVGLSIFMLRFSTASPAIILGFIILFGSAHGTVNILRPLLAREILGETNFGAKSGALAMLYLTGSAMAPFLGSLLWNWGGYDLMLLTLLSFLLVGFIMFWKAYRLTHKN